MTLKSISNLSRLFIKWKKCNVHFGFELLTNGLWMSTAWQFYSDRLQSVAILSKESVFYQYIMHVYFNQGQFKVWNWWFKKKRKCTVEWCNDSIWSSGSKTFSAPYSVSVSVSQCLIHVHVMNTVTLIMDTPSPQPSQNQLVSIISPAHLFWFLLTSNLQGR